ncbi:type VI secretion system ATPase TssH [Massilia sp. TS11]|uniref:type VI secretion system ATPase TssH n=1 Tax=Massilia sp. TS11 TaxID=2908003 RepID=UPI001EDA4CAF|nr:type VI secretion system ATPase TssH [Massilia sp. TS11]MCG2584199.1 type VI secretion system ATPase TssH [Massilia sp. TS11]
MDLNLKTLVSKFNDTTRTAAARAANLCLGLGQFEVDVEHLFLALLEQPASDVACILRHCDISLTRLESDLRAELKGFASGATRTPVFSRHLPQLFEQAWLIASLTPLQPARIRSGHLLLALLNDPALSQLAQRASGAFARIPRDRLKHDFDKLTAGSQEAGSAPPPDDAPGAPIPMARATPALERYTTDLTARARAGELDPVIGRSAEIRQTIDILLRRRQNNPILTGEAGVGKTAVVEGLALRIASGDLPAALKQVAIHVLDLGLLQAGASVKGEFESRLQAVIDEVQASPHPIILFIDEAHTLVGAGGAAGQNDAANLLKPALARGSLRTIAATTWAEYKRYFEKDAALARRFQVVKVEEPDEENACAMLRALAAPMERHFGVRILDEAVVQAVRLSHRYLSERQLPDKAIGVLDTACARVALGQSAQPAAIESLHSQLAANAARLAALERDAAAGLPQGLQIDSLRAERADLSARLAELEQRWQDERALCAQVQEIRAAAEGSSDTRIRAELRDLQLQLASLQGESPLVPAQVDGAAVAAVVAGWTGIPLGRMLKDDLAVLATLGDLLAARVVGQPHVAGAIAQRIRCARARLDDPAKPQAVFLFAGPSGVGKTETALALAELLYGGERKLITINMSEFQEAHSVSALKGSPPGYVGFGEGGVLTEAVRRQPYSVVLLDEFEKAHADVRELFYQVFDKGRLDDAEGRSIDFRNTILIATCNLGAAQIMAACATATPSPAELEALVRPLLAQAFKPALLGRMSVLPFYPLAEESLAAVVRLKLDRIGQRLLQQQRASFHYDGAVVDAILARCDQPEAGARHVDALLARHLLPTLADTVLTALGEGREILSVQATAAADGSLQLRVDQA